MRSSWAWRCEGGGFAVSFWAEPIRMPWGKTAKYVAAGLALVLAAIVVAGAQPYPSRPITMVVPFGAGGPSDTIGRIVAEGMREPLGQPLIVENVAGASGTIGVGRVAGASPHGYTIVFGNWATHVLNGVSSPCDTTSSRTLRRLRWCRAIRS